MPPKKGRAKGQKLSLSEFQGPDAVPANSNDWAECDWAEQGEQAEEQGKDASGNNRPRRGFQRVTDGHALAANKDFRSAPEERLSTMIPKDMKPPYVAHFGNLQNGITEDELKDEIGEDHIKQLRLVSREGRTFAFVEVDTVDTLHFCILMNGKHVKGRQLRVDVANEDQIKRMARKEDAEGPRGGGGGGGLGMLSRDAIGSQQQHAGEGGRDFFAGRSQVADLSRDVMGAEAARPGFGGGAPVSTEVLSDWRNAGPAVQPTLDLGNFRDAAGPGNARRGQTDEKVDRRTSPVATGAPDFASWRDGPAVSQPTFATEGSGSNRKDDAPPSTKSRDNEGRWEGRGEARAEGRGDGARAEGREAPPRGENSNRQNRGGGGGGGTWRDRAPAAGGSSSPSSNSLGNWRSEPSAATAAVPAVAKKEEKPAEAPAPAPAPARVEPKPAQAAPAQAKPPVNAWANRALPTPDAAKPAESKPQVVIAKRP